MVFVALTVKSVQRFASHVGMKNSQKKLGKDDNAQVKILAMADCEFYTNNKIGLTGRPMLLASAKNLAISTMGKQQHTFVAFELEEEVYFVILQKYNSEKEIDEDFLTCDETKIEAGFQSKFGMSMLKAKNVNIKLGPDGNSIVFTPKKKNGALIRKVLKVKPIIVPDNEESEENYTKCFEYLQELSDAKAAHYKR